MFLLILHIFDEQTNDLIGRWSDCWQVLSKLSLTSSRAGYHGDLLWSSVRKLMMSEKPELKEHSVFFFCRLLKLNWVWIRLQSEWRLSDTNIVTDSRK